MKNLLLTLGLLFPLVMNAQNLLKNGSFSKDAAGWEILAPSTGAVLETIEQSSSYTAFGLADNQAGLSFVEIDAQAAIQQKIATQAGKSYTLAFSVAHRPNAGDKQLLILVNGKTAYTQTIKNTKEAGRFIHKHVIFEATGAETQISFYCVSLSGDDTKGVLLSEILCNLENEVDLKLYYSY